MEALAPIAENKADARKFPAEDKKLEKNYRKKPFLN
jgi:hypothetical protein